MPVEVHDHARQQSAALVKFAEIEIAHFKSEIRGNVLQLAVLLKLELEIFGSGLQIVKVRRVENRVWQTNGIADTRITFVFGDGNDVGDFFQRRDFLLVQQLGADQGILPRDWEHHEFEITTVFLSGRCSRTMPRFAVYTRSCKFFPRGVGSRYTRASAQRFR